MLASTSVSLARSESFTRSRVSPRLVQVSSTPSVPPPEVSVSGLLHVSNSVHAQTRKTSRQTSRPLVPSQAPRGSPQTINRKAGNCISLEGPSTAGGSPTTTTTARYRTQWENLRSNRQSRDDTHFTFAKANKVERPEIISRRGMPMPTALPTPDATPPRGPTPDKPLVVVEELVDKMQGGDQGNGEAIGMALGSPMHPQHDWTEGPYRANTNESTQETNRHNDSRSPASPAATAKQKQSKWKGLGGLFGRKAPKSAPPTFYQLDENQVQEVEQDSSNTGMSRGRSNTTNIMGSSKRPAAPRANTTPAAQNIVWDKEGKPEPPKLQLERGSLLDVEIPNIHLDRYSVMFSGVLEKTSESSGSLLARRQATLDKLKTVNEAIAEAREEAEAQKKSRTRRETSPQPTKSPAFSLFPTSIPGTQPHPAPRTPSPLDISRPSDNKTGLFRSNTSPAQARSPASAPSPTTARSPNRSTFHSAHSDAESHIIMLDDGKALLNGISNRNAMSKKAVQFSQNKSILMLSPQSMDSDTLPTGRPSKSRQQGATPNPQFGEYSESSDSDSDSDFDTEEVMVPLKPRLTEPDWQIISRSNLRESEALGPFKQDIEMIDDSITSPVRRGRFGTVTQDSTAQPSALSSPRNLQSPLRSNPTSPRPNGARNLNVPTKSYGQPLHSPSTSSASNTTSTPMTTAPTNATTNSTAIRRARSIREIREDAEIQLQNRARSISRPRQREAQREAERIKMQGDLEEAERTLESAAGLSIARQISMSQRQRELLRFAQTSNQSSGNGGGVPNGEGRVVVLGRKAGTSNSPEGSVSNNVGVDGDGLIVSIGGLGSNRESDAMLLSSGGFNNGGPITATATTQTSNPGTALSETENIESPVIPIGYASTTDTTTNDGHERRPTLNTQPTILLAPSDAQTQKDQQQQQQQNKPLLQRHASSSSSSTRNRSRSRSKSPTTTTSQLSTFNPLHSNPSNHSTSNPSRRGIGIGMGASTMSSKDTASRIHSTINMGAMGMGAVLKGQGRRPVILVEGVGGAAAGGEGEGDGNGWLGHRYQRSERVVLDG